MTGEGSCTVGTLKAFCDAMQNKAHYTIHNGQDFVEVQDDDPLEGENEYKVVVSNPDATGDEDEDVASLREDLEGHNEQVSGRTKAASHVRKGMAKATWTIVGAISGEPVMTGEGTC